MTKHDEIIRQAIFGLVYYLMLVILTRTVNDLEQIELAIVTVSSALIHLLII